VTAADMTRMAAAGAEIPTAGRALSAANGRVTIRGRVGGWWKAWRERRATLAAFDLFGAAELSGLARDAGLASGELRVQAGKWPDAADLLQPRLATLGLDAAVLGHDTPAVLRDLQCVCSGCAHTSVCRRDLAGRAGKPGWPGYCPNATTFDALRRETDRPASRDRASDKVS
jgi:Family of unknown function (DUF6455)